MKRAFLRWTLATVTLFLFAVASFGQYALYSTGRHERVDNVPGLDPGYYGAQSVFGTYFYNTPLNVPPPLQYRARADYFELANSSVITDVVFWGYLSTFGGDQREIHIKVMSVNPSTGLPTGTVFTADSTALEFTGWGTFEESTDDPSGSLISRWRFPFNELVTSGSASLDPGIYALMIASDDQASELYWSVNPPAGKVGGVFDKHLLAFNNDGTTWEQEDLGFGPRLNKLAFEVLGFTNQGDTNGDSCIDDSDITAVILDFGSTGPFPTANGNTDIDGTGEVDDGDLTLVIINFGLGC